MLCRSIGRFFLINIDEFDQISVNQQGFLKHLLQKPVANLRKPYGTAIQEIRRYASFIATSNQKDLLTDPSGSRIVGLSFPRGGRTAYLWICGR